jgi:hypothetical protein
MQQQRSQCRQQHLQQHSQAERTVLEFSTAACRKNLEDTVPLVTKTSEYTNVTLDAVPDLLSTHEDIWMLVFARSEALAGDAAECAIAMQRVSNFTAEVGPMVRIALVSVTKQQAAENPDELFSSEVLLSDRCAELHRLMRIEHCCAASRHPQD